MLKLIRRWLGGAQAPAWNLAGYPVFELPHPGCAQALSESQAQANRVWFQATLATRQRALRDWLVAQGGPDPQALRGNAYAQALNRWAQANWDRLPAFKRLPPHRPWPDCPRGGPFIVYSLLGDLAASLGEAVRQANPDWQWGLNLDAIDLADGMHSARRIVLLAQLKHPTPEASEAVLDFEALVFAAHRFPDAADFVHLQPWARTVADAIAGGYHDF